MQNRTALWHLLARCKDRAGNVSLIFALVVVPIMGALGLAIDYGMAKRTQNMMQEVLDTATLGAVSEAADANSDLGFMARKRLRAEFERIGFNPKISVSADPVQGTVTVSADMPMRTLFMNILGSGDTTIHAGSTAVAGAGGPMDLAIAFDTTGSMTGQKLASAQQAASDLVDLVFKIPGTSLPNPNVKVGLVPFDRYVNVGTQYRNASWITVPPDYTDSGAACWPTYAQLSVPVHVNQICDGTLDCSYDDYNDYAHQIGTYCATHTWEGCVGSQNDPDDAQVAASAGNQVPGLLDTWCSAPLMRLSNDPVAIKTAISGFTAGNETYIAPGILWGWRLLSPDPNGPFVDGRPQPVTNKRLILMTDGANTHSAQYPNHEGTDVAASNAKLLQVCQNVKASGVQIYTIAFEVTDATILDVLTQCSSGPPFAYNAQTIADLAAAYHKIGADLTAPRLLK